MRPNTLILLGFLIRQLEFAYRSSSAVHIAVHSSYPTALPDRHSALPPRRAARASAHHRQSHDLRNAGVQDARPLCIKPLV
jgi:hypothetical protein